MESLDHGHRHKDHDRLLAALDVNLLGGGEGKLSELRLELGDVGLEVEESLSDLLLDLRGGSLGSVGGAQDLGVDAGHGLDGVSCGVFEADWETLTTFLRVKDSKDGEFRSSKAGLRDARSFAAVLTRSIR